MYILCIYFLKEVVLKKSSHIFAAIQPLSAEELSKLHLQEQMSLMMQVVLTSRGKAILPGDT